MAQLQIILSQDPPRVHELVDEITTVGRVEDNNLCIEDDSVSSHHAEIVADGDTFHLHDLGSTNGTFVNGSPATDAILNHGDEVRFGGINCVFLSQETTERNADAQPLPTTSAPATAAAHLSARPVDFASSSPVPRNVTNKDPIGILAVVLGCAGFLAALVVATMAFFQSGV
jgi:pSer/pThr/pTyr-binding forkhead associated (FHA) protein